MNQLNFNHLYYFWHACRAGSITAAAEALSLTPQTITGQIKALEERLQGKLFRRQGRAWYRLNWGSWFFAMLTACLC